MAIVLVTSVAALGDATSATTSAVDTTGATLLVVAIARYTANPATVSDSKGNTWVGLTEYGDGTPSCRFYYVKNPTVGSGHTFTVSGDNPYSPIAMQAFSGTDTTANADQQNGAIAASPGSITPTVDNCVIVTACGRNDGDPTVDAAFTLTDSLPTGVSYAIGMAYKVQTTATAINATWSSAADDTTIIASFKPASGGAAFIARPNIQQIQAINRASRW